MFVSQLRNLPSRWPAFALLAAFVVVGGLGARPEGGRAAQGPTEFTSAAGLTVPDSGTPPTKASLYPSPVVVDSFNEAGAVIASITVKLSGLTAGKAHDLDMMLVAPDGTKAVIFSDVGANIATNAITVTLDDAAGSLMPQATALTTGIYRPTNLNIDDTFPAPAPDPSQTGSPLGTFRGIEPNGTWNLFVVDDQYSDDGGSTLASWSLTIRTTVPPNISTSPGSTAYTVTGPPVLIDPGATVTDSDSANFNGGALNVTFVGGAGPLDELSIRDQGTGPGQIGVSGDKVTFGGDIIGTIADEVALEAAVRVTFNTAAAPIAVQALARNVLYATDVTPPDERVVHLALSDGDGGTDLAVKTIVFSEPPLLRIRKAGTGEGIVRGASGGINCGEDCFEQVELNRIVRLTAIPAAHSVFAGWRNCAASGRTCRVTLDQSRTVVATFLRPECAGVPASRTGSGVINGTAGNDVLVGSAIADTINGRGGDDIICGRGGGDRIVAGEGSDTVEAGAGQDNVSGGAGNDRLAGEAGNDSLRGGAGDDDIDGGPGRDTCTGSGGDDTRTRCEAGAG
jgi:hypothetical protein